MKSLRGFTIFILTTVFTLILGACSNAAANDDTLRYIPDVDMTQMPLYVESAGSRLAAQPLVLRDIFGTPRDGYTLQPQVAGETGVDISSGFVLTLPNPAPAGYTPDISIDGQPIPGITRQADGSFLVTPAAALANNRLYTIRLTQEGADDITWTIQTAPRFQIMSTLPGHESVNVPVNTGIEINFSARGHTDIREHFSIYPPVEGRFIQRGTTTIFMPTNPLAKGRLYTVTITAGINLPGTNEIIDEDFSFSFETADDDPARQHQQRDSLHFSTIYTEYPSFEPPSINFRLNYPHDGTRPAVDIEVFRFNDNQQAVDAVQEMLTVPRWTWFTWHESFVDVSGLTRVSNTRIAEAQGDSDWWRPETFQLPDALPPGFYIINASINNETSDQMILQITDLAVQIFADDNMTLVWVNDMTTGQPVSGAQVQGSGRTGRTDENGIATLTAGMTDAAENLVITAPDGKRCIIFHARHVSPSHRAWDWGGWGSPQASDAYWTALQLDRTLFQRSDNLYFWGFVQNREQSEEIRNVSAVLTHGWGFGMFGDRDTLHRQTVSVRGGAYSGTMVLPNLDQGSYRLTIYHGDIVLGSIFFEVQDYVKPPYQMLVSADRRAAFIGEPVTFTTRAEFFEGTPVPELAISYSMWGWQLRNDIWGQQGVTNSDGELEVTVRSLIPDGDSAQGQAGLSFIAEATLPEIGWTSRSADIQVFINDIDVRVQASREGADANLSVNVHTITLDRLNDGTAEHSGDFLDQPVAGQSLPVEIVRVYWVATRIGERYCFIERIVVPRYRHDRREEVIQRFTLTTNANGEANRDFTVPNRNNESYIARISTTDGNGRRISHDAFIGRDWWNFFMNAESGEPFLYGARPWNEGYDIGEEVNLTVMSGTEAMTQGNFLFVIASDGILEHHVGTNPLNFTFGEEHLPNATVYAVHFNGHTYHSGWNMRETLRFNSLSRELVLTVTTDQDAYRPGGTATVTIRATDTDGNPKQAYINIAAVDEALFALRDYTVDTLSELYRNISSGIRHNIATHHTFISDGHDDMRYGFSLGLTGADPQAAPASEEAADAGAGRAGETHVREIFEDTAVFAALQTNAQGEASFSFRLPDNVTSWRLTVSGITNNLYAGNDISNIIVTNPMFVHYSLNSVFLVGDVPVIGVNAFGTALSSGENVAFEVWDYDRPGTIFRAEGTAFERVNIPLWEMADEGAYSIIIRATSENGLSDAVRHNFQVIGSHRMMDTAVFYDVTPDTVFEAGRPGLTQITFTDRGRGQFLWDLMGMRWTRGVRIEGLVMRREANQLIQRYFPEVSLYVSENSFNPTDYQQADGGISMLPYSESDLAVTVRMMPFIQDEINTHALRHYLYNILEGDNAENRMLALYGLAMLREPVLIDLHNFAAVEDLPIRDVAYIALGFMALGETQMARALYDSRIQPHLQRIAPYYRVNASTRAEILEATSVVALLAAQLNMPERTGLHQYTVRNHTWDLLVNIQQLSFITHEIAHVNAQPASITYTLFGEEVTRDLANGKNFTLRIPTQNLHRFNLVSITGDVGAVSIHRVPLEDIETVDAGITITRRFFRAGERTARTTFNQGDLVRVQITVDYSRTALTGSYRITDFLPAGLVHAPNSARFGDMDSTPGYWRHAVTEGQRITFFDHNSRFNRARTYYYYARVINPGTFRAEGLIVQSMGAREYLTIGQDDIITIVG